MKTESPISIEVKHPDWLKNAAKEAETTFRLIATGMVPEPIRGWFVVTKCLHLLRCVYGSDLDSLTALKDHVMAKELEQIELHKALEKATDCPECNGPMIETRVCFGMNPGAWRECVSCGFRQE